jgi:hypothetical protein
MRPLPRISAAVVCGTRRPMAKVPTEPMSCQQDLPRAGRGPGEAHGFVSRPSGHRNGIKRKVASMGPLRVRPIVPARTRAVCFLPPTLLALADEVIQ